MAIANQPSGSAGLVRSGARVFARLYKATALLLLNVLVLLVLFNLVLFGVFHFKGTFTAGNYDGPIRKYGEALYAKLYTDLTRDELYRFFEETWSRPFVYEPFTEFKERPYAGRWINVHEAGFRLGKDQGPWPPDARRCNVFFFGGSTAFGYGLFDEQTIASALQEYLSSRAEQPVAVYNFGRGCYYSTQERVLFEKVLEEGHVPGVAIFLDGINDFFYSQDETFFTPRVKRVLEGKAGSGECFPELPLNRFVKSMSQRLKGEDQSRGDWTQWTDHEAEAVRDDDPALHAHVIERYFRNKALAEGAAQVHGVRPVFVWQPAPTYKYDLTYHPFAADGFARHSRTKYGYPLMAQRVSNGAAGANFLWCADLQEGSKETLYVDKVHYSAKFCRNLAAVIGRFLLERHLVKSGSTQS
jgi:hypothetical protein